MRQRPVLARARAAPANAMDGISASRPISTLVSTSRRPTRLNCWKIIAERARHCRSCLPRSAVTSRPSNRIRPRVGSARRLIIRSRVDLPAPERPITPTKLPGAIENEALSTAAFVPNRHVKPSTTSMHCSRKPDRRIGAIWSIASVRMLQLCDSRVAVRPSSTDWIVVIQRHAYVIKTVDDVRDDGNHLHHRWKPAMAGKKLSVEPTIDPTAKVNESQARRLYRSRRAHDPAGSRRWTTIPMS